MKKNSKEELLKQLNKNEGRGINNLLSIAYKILENPIMMFDTSYSLLAHTENTVKDDFIWNEIVQLGTFSHTSVNFFNEENFIIDVANTDIAILKSKKLKYGRANGKIYDSEGIHIANIAVVGCYHELNDEDYKNMEIICERLGIELEKSEYYQQTDRVYAETFIGNLIEGKIIDETFAEVNVAELYNNLKDNLYIGVIDITKYEYTLTHLAYFRDVCKKLQSDFKYFIYLNNIVVIISDNNSLLNVRKSLKDLNDFFVQNNIYMGISSSFQNLYEIQKYYKEALNALNFGLNISANDGHNIFEYSIFKLDNFLRNSEFHDDIKEALCNPVIFSIKEYDEQEGSNYYEVLRNCCIAANNHHLAAKRMGISYKLFCDKLNEITELFGIDWNNGTSILSIFVSMKIAKYLL